MNKMVAFVVLLASVLTLSSCGKKEEARPVETPATSTTTPVPSAPVGVAVSTITLAKAIGADKKATDATDRFSPKDTIYATVDTLGSGTAKLKAKWTWRKNGQETLVKEDVQTISPSGPATSEFHVSKSDGWPAGDYRVEIFVDDRSAGVKDFSVS